MCCNLLALFYFEEKGHLQNIGMVQDNRLHNIRTGERPNKEIRSLNVRSTGNPSRPDSRRNNHAQDVDQDETENTEISHSPNETTTNGSSQSSYHPHPLPTCKDLMTRQGSPYKDAHFLTRHTIPISWKPRADGSRELEHSMCELHRYSAEEAEECLAGKHMFWAGDSLTRYQFLSLATFLHKKKYPPRFGVPPQQSACQHLDENGNPACSAQGEPNICMEGNWRTGSTKDPWQWFMQSIGGPLFDGHMESSAVRRHGIIWPVENYLYSSSADPANRITLSFVEELGWINTPEPIHGFDFTGCAFNGTCEYSDDLFEERIQRHANLSYDFSQPFVDAIGPDGVLRQKIPPVDIALYNRGIWAPLEEEHMSNISKNLYDFSGREHGQCFYRATTGRFDVTLEHERKKVRQEAWRAGCSYIDNAHLVADFNEMPYFLNYIPPRQSFGGTVYHERDSVYWDNVHFMPWVYEELNNLQLNVLCNLHQSGDDDASTSVIKN